MEDPFACVIREVGEEIGIDNLPMPIREIPIRVGYYYLFEVNYELALHPRDHAEIGMAGWYSLEEMRHMNLNIDANVFRARNSVPIEGRTHVKQPTQRNIWGQRRR